MMEQEQACKRRLTPPDTDGTAKKKKQNTSVYVLLRLSNVLVFFYCCARVFPCRTRFYGFSLARPFLQTVQKDTMEQVATNLELTLTTENISAYKENTTDYLPVGTYQCVSFNVFFFTVATKAASPSILPCFADVVDSVQLLPPLSGQLSPLRTMTIALNVPK